MNDHSDLTIKYQRLAQEYAKLKAQNQVLKKAVVEAQDGTAKLQTDLQDKEQAIRRSQQEIESSNFRSQQMVRRIEMLQQELEQKGKKGKVIQEQTSGVASAIDEDLQMKIHENELLHKQVHEYDTEKRQLEKRYNDEVLAAKAEAKENSEALEALRETHARVSEQLQNEKLALENKLEMIEIDSKRTISELKKHNSSLENYNEELMGKINQMKSTMVNSMVFNDHSFPEYNVLKIEPHNKRYEIRAQELFKEANGLVKDLCKNLQHFHVYSKQRVMLYPIDSNIESLSSASVKLSELLIESDPLLLAIMNTFDETFSVSSSTKGVLKLENFANHFDNYVLFLSKLLPYQLTSLQEECDLSLCVPALQSKNSDYCNSFQRFLPAMSKLSKYLSFVTTINLSSGIDHAENIKLAYQKIVSAVNELHLMFKDLSKAFNGKIVLEYNLPTTSNAPELRKANEFLLGSMLSLSSITAKLCGFIQANIDFIASAISSNRNSLITVGNLVDRASDYMDKINTSPPLSVPYFEALNKRQDLECENREELLNQLKENSSKLQHLEQEKEHWLLETQLLQMKLEKQKSFEISQVAVESGRTRNESLSLKPLDTSVLGNLEAAPDYLNVGGESTEDLIKHHLTSRLTESGMKVQQAEGKALHFESECRMLHKHLEVLREKKVSLHGEVDKSSQRISQLQDELSVTRRSYEEQLSLMSEHLAAMNDKLATQKDEIDSLKTKKPKKSKPFGLH